MGQDNHAFQAPAQWVETERSGTATRLSLPVLESPRLLIRPAGLDEVAPLVVSLSDWTVAQWLLLPYPIQASDVARLVIASGNARQPSDDVLFSIREKHAGEVAGGIIMSWATGSCVSLRYWLQASSWGRGLATEALSTVMWSAFGDGQVAKVRACVDPENDRSMRVLKRLGFRLVECRRRKQINHRGAQLMLVCECTPADFRHEASRLRAAPD